jgi:hypothetical protein
MGILCVYINRRTTANAITILILEYSYVIHALPDAHDTTLYYNIRVLRQHIDIYIIYNHYVFYKQQTAHEGEALLFFLYFLCIIIILYHIVVQFSSIK